MDKLLFQALDKVNSGMVIVDRDLKILLWNQWIERYTGIKEKMAIGSRITEVCPRFKVKADSDILQNVIFHGQSRFCSSALHKAFFLPEVVSDENSIRQNVHIQPLYKEDEMFALIQISDVTSTYNRDYKLKNLIKELEVEVKEIKNTEEVIRHRSLHDSLTGLPNRLFYNDRLAWAINYAQRNEDKLAIMFLDLDGFKEVNDTYGHDAGDMILKEVAKRLKGCIRSIDTLARLGGDEFTVVLIQLKDEKNASIVAQKFISAISEPFSINGTIIRLTISIGISTYPKGGQDPTVLLKKADQAMYKIKAVSKNGYLFAD